MLCICNAIQQKSVSGFYLLLKRQSSTVNPLLLIQFLFMNVIYSNKRARLFSKSYYIGSFLFQYVSILVLKNICTPQQLRKYNRGSTKTKQARLNPDVKDELSTMTSIRNRKLWGAVGDYCLLNLWE